MLPKIICKVRTCLFIKLKVASIKENRGAGGMA